MYRQARTSLAALFLLTSASAGWAQAQESTGKATKPAAAVLSVPRNAAEGATAEGGGPAQAPGVAADVETLGRLHAANQAEIQHGEMALQKAKSPQVKAYGRKLIADHKAADKKLLAFCQKKKVDAGALDKAVAAETERAKSDPKMAELHQQSGDDFDKQFAALMAEEHQRTIELVTTARDAASDAALKGMLTKLLPTLEKHRAQAQSLVDKLNKS